MPGQMGRSVSGLYAFLIIIYIIYHRPGNAKQKYGRKRYSLFSFRFLSRTEKNKCACRAIGIKSIYRNTIDRSCKGAEVTLTWRSRKMEQNIDINTLRKDLIDYYGTASFNGFPAAVMDLSRIERMSDGELIRFALEKGVDLDKYIY